MNDEYTTRRATCRICGKTLELLWHTLCPRQWDSLLRMATCDWCHDWRKIQESERFWLIKSAAHIKANPEDALAMSEKIIYHVRKFVEASLKLKRKEKSANEELVYDYSAKIRADPGNIGKHLRDLSFGR